MVKVDALKKVNPNMDIYEAKRGQNWQMLLPLYYEYKVDFLNVPVYNWIIYQSSMSHSDHSYEDKVRRIDEHEEIKKNTINRLLISNKLKIKWTTYISSQTLRLKMFLALTNNNENDFKSNYQKLKKLKGVNFKDRLRILKRKLLRSKR